MQIIIDRLLDDEIVTANSQELNTSISEALKTIRIEKYQESQRKKPKTSQRKVVKHEKRLDIQSDSDHTDFQCRRNMAAADISAVRKEEPMKYHIEITEEERELLLLTIANTRADLEKKIHDTRLERLRILTSLDELSEFKARQYQALAEDAEKQNEGLRGLYRKIHLADGDGEEG